MEEEMKNGRKDGMAAQVIAAGVIGLVAGAAMGLLFAPKTGKETREMIVAKAKDFNEKRKETLDKVAVKAKELGESGKETAEMVASKVKTLAGSKHS